MDVRLTGSMCAAVVLACGSAAATAQPIVGAVGGDFTDEYSEGSFSYARNWVSHLVHARNVNFGPNAAQAAQPGGTWGEPRRTGYKHNWARTGATTQGLLQQGQHTGLGAQVATDGVTHAVVFIGANNFHAAPFGPYYSIYNELWSSQQVQSHIDSGVGEIVQVVTALKDAGLRVILVNVPDYGYAPAITDVYPSDTGRQRVADVISAMNVELEAVAEEHDLMFVNVFSAVEAMFGAHSLPNQTILLGNRQIDLTVADTSAHTRPWAAFVHDGLQPHTTIQGITANLIITALNMGHDTGIPILSEEEILTSANLTYGGDDTLVLHMGFYADYIVNYACYANCDRSTTRPILNVDDFTCFINLFAQNDPRANCDNSTTEPVLNVDDFTCFINSFAQGCN